MSLWPGLGSWTLQAVDADEDKAREEVEHFIEEYDELDDEAIRGLITAFIMKPYPTKEGQDS
jgi:hypothetical protein